MELLESPRESLPLFCQCLEGARRCYNAHDSGGFLVSVRLAQSQAVGEDEVNSLLEEALVQFPHARALALVNAAEVLR